MNKYNLDRSQYFGVGPAIWLGVTVVQLMLCSPVLHNPSACKHRHL